MNTLKQLAHSHKALLLIGAVCMFLISFRIMYTGRITFIFLVWNLFLAFVPYYVSLMMRKNHSKWSLFIYGGIWLVFFPNAPYLITDFIHLPLRTSPTFWFDLSLLTMFSIAGFVLAILSLHHIHALINQLYSKIVGYIAIMGLVLLSGFGIYLGRVLRWNSWDILTNPKGLSIDILRIFQSETMFFEASGFTLMFGLMIGSVYLAYLIKYDKKL